MDDAGRGQDRLMDEAIDLLIRWQNDPGNAVASDMVRAWRARSIDHERMWARVERVHGASGRVMADRQKAARRSAGHRQAGPSRRAVMLGGGLALGALGAGSLFLPEVLLRARADFITGKGEVRRIVLADQSVTTLGPDSAIAVDFAGMARRIDLLAGMSFFEVAPDPQRPFTVASGDLAVTAQDGAYEVSNDAGFVTLAVDHGRVEAYPRSAEISGALRLEGGELATYAESPRSFERGRRDAGQVALWRDKFIIAERETVSAVIARIGRWIPGRIVAVYPFVGTQRINGIFDLNDPERALEAAVHPAGGRVRKVSSMLTIISPL